MSEKHYNAAYLNETANVLKEIKLTSYKKFDSLDNGTIVDIGCGVGDDVINLSSIFQQKLQIIGIDHDLELIKIANSKKTNEQNIDFIQSEVDNLPFQSCSISGIRAERLIQHLNVAPKVFDEINRVLKVDSKAVIIETDWSSLCFYNGNVLTANKVVDFLTSKKINNGFAAKQIMNYFEKSNFKNAEIEVFTLKTNQLKDIFTYLWIDKILDEMLALAFLSQTEFDEFLNDLKKSDLEHKFICSINIVLCSAFKK